MPVVSRRVETNPHARLTSTRDKEIAHSEGHALYVDDRAEPPVHLSSDCGVSVGLPTMRSILETTCALSALLSNTQNKRSPNPTCRRSRATPLRFAPSPWIQPAACNGIFDQNIWNYIRICGARVSCTFSFRHYKVNVLSTPRDCKFHKRFDSFRICAYHINNLI